MFITIQEAQGPDLVGWLQVIVGFVAILVAGGISIWAAKHQLSMQKAAERKRDVREATASYIRAIRELVGATSQPDVALEPYRAKVGTENILYGMTIRDGLDRDKLFVLADVVIKSAIVSHRTNANLIANQKSRTSIIFRVSKPLIDGLDKVESGDMRPADLANHVWGHYMEILAHPHFRWDSEIRPVLQRTGFPLFVNEGSA